MTKSVFTRKYEYLCALLLEARLSAKLSQKRLAEKLGRQQTFISKYECGERRLDLIEFIEVAKALKLDIPSFLAKLDRKEG